MQNDTQSTTKKLPSSRENSLLHALGMKANGLREAGVTGSDRDRRHDNTEIKSFREQFNQLNLGTTSKGSNPTVKSENNDGNQTDAKSSKPDQKHGVTSSEDSEYDDSDPETFDIDKAMNKSMKKVAGIQNDLRIVLKHLSKGEKLKDIKKEGKEIDSGRDYKTTTKKKGEVGMHIKSED